MKGRTVRLIASVLVILGLAPAIAHAQGMEPPVRTAQPGAVYSQAELDQLLAPIALYPDQLLAQILMASTYPLEVVEAARWLETPANAALEGDALADALAQQDWDPSVKSLVPFPRIVRMMNDHLGWMEKLGAAFLAQQADVMDSVQRLRREAEASGNLQSNSRQVVTTEERTIIIQPASPEIIYVPVYDPAVVFVPWPYPAYPPYVFPLAGYYGGNVLLTGIFFGIGVAIVTPLWGWSYFDWHHHGIHIDVVQYNVINRYVIEHFHRPRVEHDVWEHDPYHRRGVPYRDPVSRARFTHEMVGTPSERRAYRGYGGIPSTGYPVSRQPSPVPRQPSAVQRQPSAVQRQPSASQRQPSASQRQPSASQRQPSASQRQPSPYQRQPTARTPTGVQTQPAVPRSPGRQRPPAVQQPAERQSTPPVFGGIGRGHDVRIESQRGHTSRQMTVPRATPNRGASPTHTPSHGTPPRTAPSGGGGPRVPPSGGVPRFNR